MTPELRREVYRLAVLGKSGREIAGELDLSHGSVAGVLRPFGGVIRSSLLESMPGRLGLEDRIEILVGLQRGESYAQIADRLGWHRSTIWREVSCHGGRQGYKPVAAHRSACEAASRPKETKLASRPKLCDLVIEWLERLWSPEQIAAKLREEFPNDPEMWVSHETIYKSLYIQGRGELRKELTRCLRTGRAIRKSRDRVERRGKIPGMVSISERPAEATDRAIPGHWEGDLILGKNNASAIGTLVERATRFVILLHLPDDHTAASVRDAMTNAIQDLPAHLKKSITWDQGVEMSEHAQFTIDTNIAVYFCDPHSPWQRGTNENTNGLLRQYFPKSTDLSVHDAERLAQVAHSLNTRPRKTLMWQTPAQALNNFIVATTD